MFFAFIAIRVLFVACMVFIIGYVFGGFSRKPVLSTITKISAILIIILFLALNGLSMRVPGHRGDGHWPGKPFCEDTRR